MAQEQNIKSEGEIADLKKKCDEYLNGWKRERADFLNYKKDEMERIGQLVKYANEEIILKILPILDNLCLAASHIKDEGINLIKKQLEDFLGKEGIKAIETLGKPFDANTMESVGLSSEASAKEEGKESSPSFAKATEGVVLDEVQRGYTLHDKLIRPAKVKLGAYKDVK